jgi:hypothetical protein
VPRPKGTKLTDEQKFNMAEGRRNKALGIVKPIVVVERKERKPMTVEHKAKMQVALAEARRLKIELKVNGDNKDAPIDKPKLYLKGNEEDAFDIVELVRDSLRPLHRYSECEDICMKIRVHPMWKNVSMILSVLEKTFVIVTPEIKAGMGVKKIRQKRTVSEEVRLARSEMMKARWIEKKARTNLT